MEAPLALAFTAGLVATVNPCGFAMLPAYLSYFMGLEDADAPTVTAAISRAVRVGAVVSAGFLVVFGLAGILLTAGIRTVITAMPWAAVVVGIGVTILGIALLSGFELRVPMPRFVGRSRRDSTSGVFVFGISYAIASLSCTLPVFLSVVTSTVPRLGFSAGVATFIAYGVGMSTLLLVVTVALAFGKHAMLGWLRRSGRWVNRMAGVVLIVAGVYIVTFWVVELRGSVGSQFTPIVWVERASATATNIVLDAGLPVGVGALAAVALIVIWARVANRTR